MGDDSEDSPSAPENGAYQNALVEYAANGAMYIYASDGIFTKISMVSGSSGAATIRYVDAQDADVLAEAKAYTDAHGGGSAEATFIDLTVTGYEVLDSGIINISATASKTLAEAKTLWESGALVVYRLVLSASPAPSSIYPGTYEIQPLYVGTNMAVGSYMDSANDMNMAMTHTASGVTILYYTTEQVMGNYGYVKESDLSAVATSGSYDDLSDKPTIPTVNNATLTIQRNGTTVKTFTANASSNVTANITVPTKTSDITNDSNFVASGDLATVATSGSYNDLSNKPTIPAAQVQANWTQTTTTAVDYIKNKPTLATVATSGSYNDLSNKPTIPTVNNATLTIQKNGTTVQTFTANQSTNATANITVPNITLQTTDPGEGSALAANNFIGVYS